ncbi:uncharacterized protein LOC120353994 [Nilaparvata lugens]|uniref:uncharacterized protein LOC120353994 n=1 Tax=Nilaparvata lugens TaxID=108931 RepID=UPI00193E6E96|nr:uncharacterized protein LOC120353994 [Nilaparvata lugens]
MIKPGAGFREVVKETGEVNANDVLVFLAGTNDIACNERKELQSALRSKLRDLQSRRGGHVLVFSVPHRHDLPRWSAINKEVQRANNENFILCKKFKNVSFVNITNIGRRFHTSNGLHLNSLGKKFVSQKILELVHQLANTTELVLDPIPLKHNNVNHFLGHNLMK